MRVSLGAVYLERGLVEPALRELDAASDADPRRGDVHLFRALAYRSAGNMAAASDAERRAWVVDPDDPLQRDIEARGELERALASNPLGGAARLLAAVAQWHLREANVDAAVTVCRRWIEVDPNDPVAHKALGDALRKLNRDDEALGEFLVAAFLDPHDAAAYAGIGQIHLAAERYGQAVLALQHAVDAQPNDAEARYALAAALVRDERESEGSREMEVARRLQADALAESRRAFELNGLKLEAERQAAEGKHAEAAALWQQVADRAPREATNHLKLGEALSTAGRHDLAIGHFRAALELNGPIEIHRLLAAEYERLGRADDAERERTRYDELRAERLRSLGNRR